MYNLRAIFASFMQHWKTTTFNIWSLSFFVGAAPQVAVFAWVAIKNPDSSVYSYLIIGAPLMAVWQSVFFGISTSLNAEIRNRTIELAMISRTSMITVLFGKALAMMVFGIPVALISIGMMLIVTRQLPHIASYGYLLVSVFFIFIGLAVTALVIAPITALTRGRSSGMYVPLLPLIMTFSGFLFPVTSLPRGLEITSRIIPATWGMDSVLQSVRGPESFWAVASGWIFCLLLSLTLMTATVLLFRIVEKRLRITGLMSY
jgi:ABC-2 type transport system permease protein